MSTLQVLLTEIRDNWKRLLLQGVLFAILFQVFMMAALIVRFQALPNYVTWYDWIGNVVTIVQSTPSWSDIAPIVWEEWLIEIGRMNYDYGTGISEWSLNIIPSRLLVMTGLGILMGLGLSLWRRESCSLATKSTVRATAGIGAILVAMTNATMSWVVCCATPSWVVGLAMLGLGVSSSLALESLGPTLSTAGFVALGALIVFLAWRKAHPASHPA